MWGSSPAVIRPTAAITLFSPQANSRSLSGKTGRTQYHPLARPPRCRLDGNLHSGVVTPGGVGDGSNTGGSSDPMSQTQVLLSMFCLLSPPTHTTQGGGRPPKGSPLLSVGGPLSSSSPLTRTAAIRSWAQPGGVGTWTANDHSTTHELSLSLTEGQLSLSLVSAPLVPTQRLGQVLELNASDRLSLSIIAMHHQKPT